MSVFYDISYALDNRLNTMTSLPPVAWENYPYEPALGTLYLRPTNIQGDTPVHTIGATGNDVTTGIYQVDVFAEAGQGKNAAVVMSDNIAAHFKIDTEFSYNGRLVRIRQVNRRAGFNNADGWYQIPVEIVYDAYSVRR